MKAGWEASQIGKVCIVIAGQSPKGSAYNDQGDGLPFYQGKKEFCERHIGPPTTWTSVVTKESEPGDILMSVRAPVGPINEATQRICIGRGLAAIRAKEGLDRDFLWYALLWSQPKIKGDAGAVFDSINKAGIESIPLPIPPLEEQERIVAVLDEAFEGLAHARAHTEANLQNARDLRQSCLEQAFQGRLGGDAVKAGAGFDWAARPLGDLVDVLDRLRKPITKKDRKAGPYPYFGATGVLDHVDGYLFDEPLVLIGEDGAKWEAGANSAFAIEGKTWVNNHAHVIRPHRNRVLDDWLIYYLNGTDLMLFISGMTIPKLNQGRLREIPIPLPPLEEQHRIVAVLDKVFEHLSYTMKVYQAKIHDLDNLRQSLLQKAFMGELI